MSTAAYIQIDICNRIVLFFFRGNPEIFPLHGVLQHLENPAGGDVLFSYFIFEINKFVVSVISGIP
jgi:hypothetical protein